jgi:hypothetical protein
MSPCAVCTPLTAPFFFSTPVTGTPSKIFAPFILAPLASAIVMSTGFACPSSLT